MRSIWIDRRHADCLWCSFRIVTNAECIDPESLLSCLIVSLCIVIVAIIYLVIHSIIAFNSMMRSVEVKG